MFIGCTVIVVARIGDVSFGTMRTVAVVSGHRGLAWLFGFLEVIIWVFAVSAVIAHIRTEPAYGIAFAIGAATGNYVGVTLLRWLPFGDQVEERLRSFCEPVAQEVRALKASFRGIEHNRGWEGYAWGLVRFIHDEEVDLAVLGTRSSWNPRDFLMGSTAERVVRDARCSIVALKGTSLPSCPEAVLLTSQ